MSNKDSHGGVQLFLEVNVRLLKSFTVIDKWLYGPEMYSGLQYAWSGSYTELLKTALSSVLWSKSFKHLSLK